MRRLLSPVAQFALSGLLVVLAVAVVGVLAVRHISRNEALRDAKQVTELAGNAVVAPAIEPGVLDENPAALAKLDRVVRCYVLRDPVVRVKLWDESGRIVYSDEPRLIGKRFALEPDERELFRRPGVRADVSDLSRPGEPLREGPGPAARGLSRHPRPARRAAAVRDLPARGRDLGRDPPRVARRRSRSSSASCSRCGSSRSRSGGGCRAACSAAQHQARHGRPSTSGAGSPATSTTASCRTSSRSRSRSAPRRTTRPAQPGRAGAIRRLRTLLGRALPRRPAPPGPARARSSDLLAPLQSRGLTTTPGRRRRPRPRPRHRGALLPHRPRGAAQRRRPRRRATTRHRPRHRATRSRSPTTASGFTRPADDRPHLGLRMLDDLAREHGGALEIRSTPGRERASC